jgi:hypothetical protein
MREVSVPVVASTSNSLGLMDICGDKNG